jgi:predicted alpha/beta-hydrolase family hydrolase
MMDTARSGGRLTTVRIPLSGPHVGQRRDVSGLLLRPEPASARRLLVLAHGAGAGMEHSFMEAVSRHFAAHRTATLRFQFPYTEEGSRRPDAPPLLMATVQAAIAAATEMAAGLPLLAGGKSMGGRMTSLAAAKGMITGPRGLVFLGFPLHAAGKPSASRGAHLADVRVPMLFLQGTRDRLADLDLLRPLCDGLGTRATLHIIDGADHSFHVPKRSGRSEEAVLDELAAAVDHWADRIA